VGSRHAGKDRGTKRHGIVAARNASNNFSFVKRHPDVDVPASSYPEQVAGCASPSSDGVCRPRGRLGWDLTNEKKTWKTSMTAMLRAAQVSPDGSFMYVGSDLKDFWYVVNPTTGEMITKSGRPEPSCAQPESEPGGQTSPSSSQRESHGDRRYETQLLKTIASPTTSGSSWLNHDASLIYANLNNLLDSSSPT